VPLMIANLCSYVLSQKLQHTPIYEALAGQEGITMPSAAHLPEPLTVEPAMQPLRVESTASGAVPEKPFAHPDDPLDAALQRMGEAGVDEIPVVSRTGGMKVGVISARNALDAYQRLAGSKQEAKSVQNWLPVVAAITVAAVLIVSGLVFWQRSRRAGFGVEAYRTGERLLGQGQIDEAVSAFRNGLAQAPQDIKTRTALGLALVQSGHHEEAESYLSSVVKVDSGNGPAWAGLAEIRLAAGDRPQAMVLFRRALAKEWPAQEDSRRLNTQIRYAVVLSEAGRKREAIPLLLSMIAQHGDDAAVGKRAADLVKEIGTPEQAEEAYVSLAALFPADASVWLRLGEARFAAAKDVQALDAFRRAVKADPEDEDARQAVTRVEDALQIDPTRRGLSVKERARRWDEILQRVLAAAAQCGSSPEVEKAKPLLNQRAGSLELSDRKMEAALSVWKGLSAGCKTDAVLTHIVAKAGE